MSKKVYAAKISIFSNTFLIIIKLIMGIFTGSVSIISEAIHSTVDLVASVVAFFSVKIADLPPDENHQFGHEKVENISGVIEAVLIFIASFVIIGEAIKKIVRGGEIESIGLGFIVMFMSAGVNFFVSKYLYKVAKEEESIALEADALHLKADVVTSFGVGVGLLIIHFTGLNFLDPIIAIIIAIFILKEAFEMLQKAFHPLLDAKLSDEEINEIKKAVGIHNEFYIDFHELRTRSAGKTKHIDMHLTLCKNLTVSDSHEICDKIESDIEKSLKNTKVLIHVEPCKKEHKETEICQMK